MTSTQSNVLSIPRGAGSAGLACSQLSERRITHDQRSHGCSPAWKAIGGWCGSVGARTVASCSPPSLLNPLP